MQSSDIWRTCLWLIFRWGTTKKRPSLSKRWTLRRGCSWCTGPTPAGRSNWRRTQTSRRNLKRLDDTLSFKLWQEEDRIFFVNHMCFALPVLGLVRRCQAALDWSVQVFRKNLLTRILVCALQICMVLTLLTVFQSHICWWQKLLLRAPNAD